jgi:transcription elongation GreA/GreB family factor
MSIKFKQEIIAKIIKHLKVSLDKLETSTQEIKKYSQSDELKQESKYDTRAIEAGYLRDAQVARLDGIKNDIKIVENIDLTPKSIISVGSLIKLKINDLNLKRYFVSSVSGPGKVKIDNDEVVIVTLKSSLGQELVQLTEGDSFIIENDDQETFYEVLKVE